MKKKLDDNYTRILRAILNKYGRQHPTKHHLYGHLSPITKTIQIRRARHAGHCWKNKDELIRDILLWTPAHGLAKVGQQTRIYIQQLFADTGCNLEDLLMDDRDGWQERSGRSVLAVRHDDDDDIYIYIYIYIFIHWVIKKMLTPLWKSLYDIISNSLHIFTILINTFLESPTGD